MNSVSEMVNLIATHEAPRKVLHRGEESPFLLSCRLSDVPASEEMASDLNVGPSLRAFWSISSEADLFKDETYGQWGLRILSPGEAMTLTSRARACSPEDVQESDFIVGEFYGDSEQLIIDASEAGQGKFPVLIRLPIDQRSEWPLVADSFEEFLERYIAADGDKFWEA